MLGKLVKHELNATARILLPLYSIMIIITLVNSLLINIDIFNGPLYIVKVFMLFAYGISILATVVVTFIVMVLRFYKNLMSDEGYLMFTLPAKPSQLINSKLLVSLLWSIVSVIVVVASILILIIASQRLDILLDFKDELYASLKLAFGGKYVLLIIQLLLIMFISLNQQILLIYVSIAVGHLLGKNKVLGSFAAYVAITTIAQIVVTLILVAWSFLAGSTLNDLDAVPQLVFPFSIIGSALFSVLFYSTTNYIFNKKLNLE